MGGGAVLIATKHCEKGVLLGYCRCILECCGLLLNWSVAWYCAWNLTEYFRRGVTGCGGLGALLSTAGRAVLSVTGYWVKEVLLGTAVVHWSC